MNKHSMNKSSINKSINNKCLWKYTEMCAILGTVSWLVVLFNAEISHFGLVWFSFMAYQTLAKLVGWFVFGLFVFLMEYQPLWRI